MTENRRRPGDILRRAGSWAGMSLLCALAFGGLALTGIPAAALLGPMAVGIVAGVRRSPLRPARWLIHLAQGIAGCMIAANMDPALMEQAAANWPAVLAASLATLIASFIASVAFSRMTTIPAPEAAWGFLPGMAGLMIALAEARGLDGRIVAVIQIVRLVLVITILSVVAWGIGPGTGPVATQETIDASDPVIVLAIALTGVLAARRWPLLSAAATLVPLAVGTAVQVWTGRLPDVPAALSALAFGLIGVDIGLRFTPQVLRAMRALPGPLLLSVTLLLAACALAGAGLALWLEIDLTSAILATVPGSIEAVTMIAIACGANVTFVVTLQTVRLIAVVILGPALVALLLRCMAPPPNPGDG